MHVVVSLSKEKKYRVCGRVMDGNKTMNSKDFTKANKMNNEIKKERFDNAGVI